MNTTTSVDAKGQEISETHELTSKAREFLERADVIVAGAEARRWILDLVEFIEKTSSERDALDVSTQENFQDTLQDIQQRLKKIEKQGENNGKALSYAAVAAGKRKSGQETEVKNQGLNEENTLREKRKMKEIIVRIEDPKEQEALGKKTTKEIVDALRVSNEEVTGIRRLPSGDLKIHVKTPEVKETLQAHSEWIKRVAASATIRKEGYAILAHGVKMNEVRGSKQAKALEYLTKENAGLHEGLKINRVAWSARARKQNKRYASLHIEVETAEMANRLILVGLADEGEIKTCELFEAGCKLTQCFNCQQYGNIAKFCKNPTVCGYCVGRHDSRNCPCSRTGRSLRCAVCGDKGHPAWAAECQVRKEKKHRTEITRESRRRLYAVPPPPKGNKAILSQAQGGRMEVVVEDETEAGHGNQQHQSNKPTDASQNEFPSTHITNEVEPQEGEEAENEVEMTETTKTIR